MAKKLIDLLKDSESPHLYLVNVGLTKEQYSATSALSGEQKEELVQKIISQATPEEILKIVNDLTKLEVSVEWNDPIRSGNRLLGTLIRLYVAQQEQSNFRDFYKPEKTLDDYPIPTVIRQLWRVVKEAAKSILSDKEFAAFETKGLRIVPIFYYQQLLMPTPEEIMKEGKKPIELTRNDRLVNGFNANLMREESTPQLAAEKDMCAHLRQIKEHIKSTEWKVGDYLLFKGGVMHEKQRVPHRIKDILKQIEQAEKDPTQIQTVYATLIVTAKEAIDNPRKGRASTTTEFYKDIFNHRVLKDNYLFKTAEADKAPLLQ